MERTSRTFEDVENGHICRLYTSKDRSVYHLIVELQAGQFYNLKESEKATHIKYVGFTRFTKLK
jgi:hypothetical protein